MGAIVPLEVENWRETADNLRVAVTARRLLTDLKMVEEDSLSVGSSWIRGTEIREQYVRYNRVRPGVYTAAVLNAIDAYL